MAAVHSAMGSGRLTQLPTEPFGAMSTPRTPLATFSFLVAIVMAGVGLLTACGGGGTVPNEVADIQTPAGDDATTEPDDGTSAAAQDGGQSSAEDGGADAAEVADPTPAPTPLPTVGTYASIDDFVGSGDAITLSRGLRNRMILLTGCTADVPVGAIATNDEHVAAIIAAVPDAGASGSLQTAIGHIDQADAACGTDAAAWATSMRSALGELQQVEAAFGGPPADAVDVGPHPDDNADLRHVSTDLTSMNDRLYAALSGRNAIQASNVWYASAHLAHARGLSALGAQGQSPEAVVIGDSTAAFLAPPQALADQTGFTVANLGIDGSRLGTHIAVVDQFLELSPGTQTVIWPLTTLMFFRDCPFEADGAVDNVATQQAAFAPIPELAALAPIDRLVGGTDPNGPIYGGTTINEDATKRYPEGWVFGTRQFINIEVNPEGEQNQVNRWSSTFNDPQVCNAEFAALQAKATELRESGRRVVLVAGPLSNDLTILHPEGRPAHDAVVARMAQTASDAGVEFVNLSASISEDQFRDLTHVNTAGAAATVSLLAEALVVPT